MLISLPLPPASFRWLFAASTPDSVHRSPSPALSECWLISFRKLKQTCSLTWRKIIFSPLWYQFLAYAIQGLVSCEGGILLAYVVWNFHRAIDHSRELAPVEWVASLLLSTILVASLSARQAGTDRSSPSSCIRDIFATVEWRWLSLSIWIALTSLWSRISLPYYHVCAVEDVFRLILLLIRECCLRNSASSVLWRYWTLFFTSSRHHKIL